MLPASDIEAIAEAVAQKQMRFQSPVLTTAEAIAFVGKNSASAFGRWCAAHKVKPCDKGRYSRRALEMGLNKEARKGER